MLFSWGGEWGESTTGEGRVQVVQIKKKCHKFAKVRPRGNQKTH